MSVRHGCFNIQITDPGSTGFSDTHKYNLCTVASECGRPLTYCVKMAAR